MTNTLLLRGAKHALALYTGKCNSTNFLQWKDVKSLYDFSSPYLGQALEQHDQKTGYSTQLTAGLMVVESSDWCLLPTECLSLVSWSQSHSQTHTHTHTPLCTQCLCQVSWSQSHTHTDTHTCSHACAWQAGLNHIHTHTHTHTHTHLFPLLGFVLIKYSLHLLLHLFVLLFFVTAIIQFNKEDNCYTK